MPLVMFLLVKRIWKCLRLLVMNSISVLQEILSLELYLMVLRIRGTWYSMLDYYSFLFRRRLCMDLQNYVASGEV